MGERHRWVKLRLHVYICAKCGTGRVNAQIAGGAWQVTYHRPTGESVVSSRVPECEVGERTAAYCAKYFKQITETRGRTPA